MLDEPEEEMTDADWLDETELAEEGDPFHRHLRLLLWRLAGAFLILGLLVALKSAGRPGRWAVDRVKSAIAVDFTPIISAWLRSEKLASYLQTIRTWFGREIEVTTTPITQDNSLRLLWPVRDFKLLVSSDPMHPSLNLQVPAGSPIRAAAEGTALEIRLEKDDTTTLIIRHDEAWRTVYARCQAALIAPGEQVGAGQVIALVGSAAPPVPAYLHFELWRSTGPVDPRPYMGEYATGHVQL